MLQPRKPELLLHQQKFRDVRSKQGQGVLWEYVLPEWYGVSAHGDRVFVFRDGEGGTEAQGKRDIGGEEGRRR
jgi:hypothetical protein